MKTYTRVKPVMEDDNTMKISKVKQLAYNLLPSSNITMLKPVIDADACTRNSNCSDFWLIYLQAPSICQYHFQDCVTLHLPNGNFPQLFDRSMFDSNIVLMIEQESILLSML